MISRRVLLKKAFVLAGAFQLGGMWGKVRAARASTGLERAQERVLNLHNVHTGERLRTQYWANGGYDQNEINRIWYLLRCHYTNVVKPINIGVIDLLCEVKDRFGRGEEINIISGYRSPEYNEYLIRLGRHVAAGSLHLAGLAIDFVIPGIGTRDLSRAAKKLEAGGVGLYPDFVHIDVGRVRYW
jgi:uncharacterized protein YcbK (DUF882 family)